jgi:hypothetical protein
MTPADALDAAELARLAASIPIPVDAFGPSRAYAEAVCDGPDHAPDAPCSHRSGYRVCFGLDGGRRREPVGPVFDRPRDAVRLAELLTGASDTGGSTAGAVSAEPAQPRVCIGCEQPLPAGSRPQRRTCSVACRQRLARGVGPRNRAREGPKGQGPQKCDAGGPLGWVRSARPEPHPEHENGRRVNRDDRGGRAGGAT